MIRHRATPNLRGSIRESAQHGASHPVIRGAQSL
jgi:hypothetical protein